MEQTEVIEPVATEATETLERSTKTVDNAELIGFKLVASYGESPVIYVAKSQVDAPTFDIDNLTRLLRHRVKKRK